MISATGPSRNSGFTLIELIMVMTILAVTAAIVTPRLGSFFRGRILDSEARRMLALTRHARERAVSEGIPMLLWIDSARRLYGLCAEPGFSDQDPKASELTLHQDVAVEVTENPLASAAAATTTTSASKLIGNLPAIRFLPDGSLAETSPMTILLRDRDGGALWVVEGRNKYTYEIRSQNNLWSDTRW